MRLKSGVHGLLIAALVSVAGCQSGQTTQALALPDPVPVDGIGYLLLNAPIGPSSRDLLIADIGKLHSEGAREIHIGINSPGGDVDAAQAIVDYMNRLHTQDGVTFKAYNVRMVASAATYVFLNAQDRYAAQNSAFLFHAAGVISNGAITAENLRDQATKLEAYERLVRATLKARTHLTDPETQTYVRRTVILNSDDARRDGVIDAIANFTTPPGARSWVIALRPPSGAPPAPAAPPR